MTGARGPFTAVYSLQHFIFLYCDSYKLETINSYMKCVIHGHQIQVAIAIPLGSYSPVNQLQHIQITYYYSIEL